MKNIIVLLILSCFLVGQDFAAYIHANFNSQEYFFEGKKGKIETIKNVSSPNFEPARFEYVGKGKMLKKTFFRAFSMYDNDQIKEEGIMWVWKSSSYKDGKWKGWNEKGQKLYEANYNMGKLDGLYTEWNERGKKLHEINYKEGEKHGLATFYSIHVIVSKFYNEGEIIKISSKSLWKKEEDKNYQAAYALAQEAFLSAVDENGDPVERNKDFVELKTKSGFTMVEKVDGEFFSYTDFVFIGDLQAMVYVDRSAKYAAIQSIHRGGGGLVNGVPYYERKVSGTGERTYFIECDDGECSIVDEKSEY